MKNVDAGLKHRGFMQANYCTFLGNTTTATAFAVSWRMLWRQANLITWDRFILAYLCKLS